MYLEIYTPEKRLFKGEVDLVRVPGTNGSFEILHNHAPIISTLDPGIIKIIKSHGGTELFQINGGGVIELKNNKIIILAEKA